MVRLTVALDIHMELIARTETMGKTVKIEKILYSDEKRRD